MIRLINIETLSLEEFHDDYVPPYAIASHRWLSDEITFQTFKAARNKKARKAFAKIEGFCRFLRSNRALLESLFGAGLNHVWIDTCCINKESMPELSESINLMFQWYNQSAICIAYLFDVEGESVETSSWFTRGWTLQELLAPGMVLFVDSKWNMQGYKQDKAIQLSRSGKARLSAAVGPVLHQRLSQRTRVPEQVLTDIQEIDNVSFSQVLDWMEGRYTARLEDQAYCLLGILDVRMPLNYGERDEAMIRLLHGIRTKCELRVSRPKAYDLSEESVLLLKQQLELLEQTIARLDKDKRMRRFKSRAVAQITGPQSRKRSISPLALETRSLRRSVRQEREAHPQRERAEELRDGERVFPIRSQMSTPQSATTMPAVVYGDSEVPSVPSLSRSCDRYAPIGRRASRQVEEEGDVRFAERDETAERDRELQLIAETRDREHRRRLREHQLTIQRQQALQQQQQQRSQQQQLARAAYIDMEDDEDADEESIIAAIHQDAAERNERTRQAEEMARQRAALTRHELVHRSSKENLHSTLRESWKPSSHTAYSSRMAEPRRAVQQYYSYDMDRSEAARGYQVDYYVPPHQLRHEGRALSEYASTRNLHEEEQLAELQLVPSNAQIVPPAPQYHSQIPQSPQWTLQSPSEVMRIRRAREARQQEQPRAGELREMLRRSSGEAPRRQLFGSLSDDGSTLGGYRRSTPAQDQSYLADSRGSQRPSRIESSENEVWRDVLDDFDFDAFHDSDTGTASEDMSRIDKPGDAGYILDEPTQRIGQRQRAQSSFYDSDGNRQRAESPSRITGDADHATMLDRRRVTNNICKKSIKVAHGQVCFDCGVMESAQWRKGPRGTRDLCNECGLRWAKKEYKRARLREQVMAPSPRSDHSGTSEGDVFVAPPWVYDPDLPELLGSCQISQDGENTSMVGDAAVLENALPASLRQAYPNLLEPHMRSSTAFAGSTWPRPPEIRSASSVPKKETLDAQLGSHSTYRSADNVADHPFWNPLKSARRLDADL